ncbi:MAG: hypothetical protein AAGD07_04885 [Planctomycetota bacterium]
METSDTSQSRLAQRRFAVLALYTMAGIRGSSQIVSESNALLYWLSWIGFGTCATLWFVIDRRIQGKACLPILRMVFFFSWPLASLVHVVSTRGFRGLGIWGLHVVGLYATMFLTYIPTALLLHWFGMVDFDAGAAATPQDLPK